MPRFDAGNEDHRRIGVLSRGVAEEAGDIVAAITICRTRTKR